VTFKDGERVAEQDNDINDKIDEKVAV